MDCPFVGKSPVDEHKGEVKKRHLNTCYNDEESNWMTSCYECFKATWDTYDDFWSNVEGGSPFVHTLPDVEN